ncbi:hypothetical protein [Roseococcus sp. YIM B11640]|uniref:hypothetical protein n=1 Tax=Roseococcus sp. YIM B11640 TaxID=3133973 RepID=UPI003C7C63EC
MRIALSSMALATLLVTAPLLGAQALTEDEARSVIEQHGYTGVGALEADARGYWHGRVLRNGAAAEVNVDRDGHLEDRLELAALLAMAEPSGQGGMLAVTPRVTLTSSVAR